MDRPVHLCRSWLFVEGGNEQALTAAASSGADVLIQELEDFTTPALRPQARNIAPDVYKVWREAGAVVAVRVNPLDQDGMDDLRAVMKGAPDIVALPKVSEPEHVIRLAAEVSALEQAYGITAGTTRLLPNIELARGIIQTYAIATASDRIVGCLMASEDLAADLGAERAPDGLELDYCRRRFIVECVAAGKIAVDCPYTWSDQDGLRQDTAHAKRLGYTAKSAVDGAHAVLINDFLTPSESAISEAERIVHAFETSRAEGRSRAELDGSLVEVPTYTNAKRLLDRAAAFATYEHQDNIE